MRSYVQDTVEQFRKDAQSILGQTHLAISVLNDCFAKLDKRISLIEDTINGKGKDYSDKFDELLKSFELLDQELLDTKLTVIK